ncbi:MAG TPA: MaoC/PaaZ C-terminal domain-containing protein [Steroidobacteraceae bacterium]|nr:MaoC/PaaZ C-terminal domain-containing protein [Steroidobacteraceae bacterium]
MPLNYEKLMSMKLEPTRQTYARRDTMLYALGVGVGALDPCDPQELKYVYEKLLVALPTLAVTLAAGAMRLADPSFGINYRMLLHAEQSLLMHKPLPVEGTVVSEATIDEIYDKGAARGAIMYMTRRLYEASSGDLLVTMGNVAFLRADGGFGGKSEGAPKPRPIPADRGPDLQAKLPVTVNQALIYRLAGDYNPLHIDPEVARSAGFERPILHGLGAYGMVGRALIKTLCGDDPGRLRRLDVRFTNPVYPGEPLRVEIWQVGAGDAAFRLVAADRNLVVQDFGRIEYEA